MAENGIDDTKRVWWVQAEAIVGFVNLWEKKTCRGENGSGEKSTVLQENNLEKNTAALQDADKYLDAAKEIWNYITSYFVDPREGSEWFENVNEDHTPMELPIVQPWKCPYHNGRMCMEVMRRLGR